MSPPTSSRRRVRRARQSARGGTELRVEILDEERIAELGMGLLLGVARGSCRAAARHRAAARACGCARGRHAGLVGKGITFDTGGISIKPADGMDRMKVDMGGGAAVIAAMRGDSRLRRRSRVIGIVPLTENMPGGRAVKPGDILRSASGKTVEVLNTDAEGRLVLGDGLWYAQQLGATHLVDVATLTGACVVALGRWASRAVRPAGRVGRRRASRRRIARASARGRCRSTMTTSIS